VAIDHIGYPAKTGAAPGGGLRPAVEGAPPCRRRPLPV